MQVPIGKIQIKEGRRSLDAGHVKELADSIRELGLLNPLTIDRDYVLIAGLHRLEAVKALGWEDVECTVSSLEGLAAELAEIDESIKIIQGKLKHNKKRFPIPGAFLQHVFGDLIPLIC